MSPIDIKEPETQRTPEEFMSDALSPITVDIVDRLSRIEANVIRLAKVVEGNGVPGLIQRVDALESASDKKKGGDVVKTRWMAVAMTIVVSLLSGIGALLMQYNTRAIAERDVLNTYIQREDSRIQTVEIQVAVLLQGLKGDPGTKGKTGAAGEQGKPGAKGDKGGIRLFGK